MGVTNWYHSLILWAVGTIDDSGELKRQKIVAQLSVTGTIVLWAYAAVSVLLGYPVLALLNAAVGGAGLALFLLVRFGCIHFSKYWLVFVMPALIFSFPVIAGPIASEYYFLTFMVISYYLFSRWWLHALSTLYTLGLFVLAKYLYANHIPLYDYGVLVQYYYYFNLGLATLLVALASNTFRKDTAKLQKQTEDVLRKLEQQLAVNKKLEKETALLVEESNTRVKKNYSLIKGMLSVDIYSKPELSVSSALSSTKCRLHAVQVLHDLLVTPEIAKVDHLENYVRHITTELLSVYKCPLSVEFDFSGPDTVLPQQSLTHVGLIVNELLTNALKYSAAGAQEILKVSVTNNGMWLQLAVTDSAPLFSPDDMKTNGFGLSIISTLAGQYNGILTVSDTLPKTVSVKLDLEMLHKLKQ